jgi:hypothetical protein
MNPLQQSDIIRVAGHACSHLAAQSTPEEEEVSDCIEDLVTNWLIWKPPLTINSALGSDQEEVIEATAKREPLTLKMPNIFDKAKGSR